MSNNVIYFESTLLRTLAKAVMLINVCDLFSPLIVSTPASILHTMRNMYFFSIDSDPNLLLVYFLMCFRILA